MRPFIGLITLLSLGACNGEKGVDADGDGVPTPEDCDDADPAVNPSVPEACNGLDDNCNGDVDEFAAIEMYLDDDGDGFGADGSAAEVCSGTPGYVRVAGDCDDVDATVNPDALEDCDPVDRDCDGDPIVGATDFPTYYLDADGDGYGVDTSTLTNVCTPAAGTYAEQGGDCDDTRGQVNPAELEICDGLDNDCNDDIDDGADDAVLYYADTDEDLFGDAGYSTLACAAPEGFVSDDTDCDDADGTSYPGNVETCDGGVDNDCDPTTDEATTALNYRDADGDGYGTDLDTVLGCSAPLGYVSVSGDCDDTDENVNPDDTPNCTRSHCGTISLSETWSPPVKHLVTCDTNVQGAARPTLTLDAGVVVEFSSGTYLRIADTQDGRIVVNGTPLVPVTMTSDQTVKSPGQWEGLWILGRDTGSEIHSLVVEAGGAGAPLGSVQGGVVVTNADIFIEDLRSTGNLGAGLVVNAGAEPLIVRSTFTENTGNGIAVAVSGGFSRDDENGDPSPSFQDNVVTGNGARPITIPGSHADEIDLSNVLSPNSIEEIELLSGILRFSGSWYDHGLAYVVATNAEIKVEDGPLAHLHVEDDVEVYFNTGGDLQIGVAAAGRLSTGTNTVFTGTDSVIANSLNWDGITFGPNDSGSIFADAEVGYGGANTRGNLYVNGSRPVITRIESHDSDNAGVYVSGALAAPAISDCEITNNDTDGVFVDALSGVARDSLGPTFSGNLLTGNGLSPVVFPPNFIGELDPSTIFSGNGDRIGVHGGTVLDNADWRELDEDYEIRGDVFIGGPRDPIVDIADEVHIYFDANTSLRAGTVDDGILRVNGSPANGVLFTSSDQAPGKGDWEGVMLGGTTTNGLPDHQLSNLTIRYAGGSDVNKGGAIEFVMRSNCGPDHTVNLNDVHIEESTKAAYYQWVFGTVRFDGFTMDSTPDVPFHFDSDLPYCVPGYVVESTVDDSAKGIEVPSSFTDFGAWPAHEFEDLADPSNVFSASPRITQTTITQDSHIPNIGVPVIVESKITLGGPAAPVFLVDPGVELRFEGGAGIECGLAELGAILATDATFTSASSSPAGGDWEGLTFFTSCAVRLENTRVEYAGGNGFGAIYVFGSCCGQDPVQNVFDVGNYLLDVHVHESAACGMYGVDPLPFTDPYFAPNGSLPAFDSTFSGSIGGLGNFCN